jgi:uncharacterized membrane protein YczE
MKRRIVMMLVSVPIMALGIAFFTQSGMGLDPFNGMNMGLSIRLGVSYGIVQMVVNAMLLIVMLLVARRDIHVGTLVNLVGLGFIVDFYLSIFARVFPEDIGLWGNVALMMAGLVVICFGAALYLRAELGIAPYDSMVFTFQRKTGWSYRVCRVILDVVCVVFGLLLGGGVVGVGTVVAAICIGPLVNFFMKYVADKILQAGKVEQEETASTEPKSVSS